MTDLVLPVAAALATLALALYALAPAPRSLAQLAFAAGALLLSLEEAAKALALATPADGGTPRWLVLRLAAVALLPGAWLCFSLVYARADPERILRRWRLPLALLSLGPLLPLAELALRAPDELRGTAAIPSLTIQPWTPAYWIEVSFVLGAVAILMNLEWTYRASSGSKRWRVKYMLLGLATLFAARVYTSSQALVLSSNDLRHLLADSAALAVAVVLMAIALRRNRFAPVDILIPPAVAYDSLTLLVAAVYFITAGVLPVLSRLSGSAMPLTSTSLAIFVVFVMVTVLLLSEQVRLRVRRFLSRAFGRPQYDYRKVWTEFTERTSAVVDARGHCDVVARMVSETLGTPDVCVWLLDDSAKGVSLGGSTHLSLLQARELVATLRPVGEALRRLGRIEVTLDLRASAPSLPPSAGAVDPTLFRESRARYCAPIAVGTEVIGVMTLSDRIDGRSFTFEDHDLLRTFADQAAASLHHLRLSEQLLSAKEMAAFQTLSAFFVHDLKNLASRLSVAMQNLPKHFDDPEFRSDMLGLIQRSVSKIDDMCNRLSPLSRTLEVVPVATDLNALVGATVAALAGSLRHAPSCDLQPVPGALVDPEQLRRVLVNLVLNADEASGEPGAGAGRDGIRVSTAIMQDRIVITVADRGCGMSEDFISRSLFRPFKTTKKRGLGIGLFHSRKIVEAHGGTIEVESVLGTGSTFRVVLPAAPPPPV